MKRIMYGTSYGEEIEYPEVLAQRQFTKEIIDLIHEDPEKEKMRLDKNALIVSENMRTEAIYWLKYTMVGFTAIIAYTVLFAYLG